LPSGVTQADNLFVTTLKRDGIVYYDSNSTTPRDAWFNGKLRVRVSKPAVTTIGGGTSFVGGGDNISNVGDVSLTGKE
jgi:hypothetical protein